MKKRIFSMLIIICMVFSMMPMSVLAKSSNIGGSTSNVTDNDAACPHTDHDEACGYIKAVEAAACTHLDKGGNYTCAPTVSGNEASPSDAKYVCQHSDGCGFATSVEASPCTHSCERCQEQASPLVQECNCIVKCTATQDETEAVINANCPVCGAEKADLTACAFKSEKATMSIAPYSTAPLSVTGGTLGTDYTYANNILTVNKSTALTISGTTATDKIVVNTGVTANITLNGVNIVNTSTDFCAFELKSTEKGPTTVNLTLTGTNTLTSGKNKAGLQMTDKGTLVISGTGTLNATGGEGGAGIGSAIHDIAGTTTINNGTVTATGGRGGAGIGGGHNSDGYTTTINGGTVTAIGGGPIIAGGSDGKGIGGGEGGEESDNTITGGSVFASSFSLAPTSDGSTPVYLGKLVNQVDVTNVMVGTTDYKISKNHTGDNALYLYMTGKNQAVNVTRGGKLHKYNATYVSATKSFTFLEDPSTVDKLTVTGGTLSTDYTYANNILTVNKSTALTISGTIDTDKIVVNTGVTANITLNGVNIVNTSTDFCAFELKDTATVNLTLAGTNTLASGNNKAGLLVPNGATLVISGTGTLNATGGEGGAGIGSAIRDAGGIITITDGTVTATGGRKGAGIGGGSDGAGGTITISGGAVTATGGLNAAGIGNGSGSDGGSTITISGGAVTATGGVPLGAGVSGGAGIGSAIRDAGVTTKITGGSIIASSIPNAPTSDGTTPVYLGKLVNQAGVTNVKVGTTDYKISKNHTGDTALYLYMTGQDQTVDVTKSANLHNYNATYVPATTSFTFVEIIPSTISPTTATFDKYVKATSYADVVVVQTLNGNTLTAIKNGLTTLTEGTDYAVSNNTITIKKEYLATQSVGATTLTFDYNTGTDPILTVTVSDSAPANAVAPSITTDLSANQVIYTVGDTATPLEVAATTSDGGTISYQWYSNTTGGIPISNAINATYTPPTTPGTTYYYCVVTNTNSYATVTKTATTTSAVAHITVKPALTGTVTITGTLKFNEQLTANVAGGNHSGTLSYQWKRDTADIGTNQTYTTVAGDVGQTLTCVVTSTDQTGSISGATTAVIGKADGSTTAPTVTFTLSDGANKNKLIGSTNLMEYSLDGGTIWTGCTANMDLSSTTITVAHGIKIRVKATATLANGAEQTIAITQATQPGLTPTQPTTINGTGSIPMTSVHEYKLSTDTTWIPATGTTSLGAGTYDVRVKATDTALASTNQSITIIAYVPPALTGTVTITGTLKFNEQLTANVAGGNHSGTLSYQWKRGTADIGTNQTYTTVAGDVGQTLTCVVTSTDQTGSISGTTTAVIGKADGSTTAPTAPTINYTNETLTTGTTLEYQVDSNSWANCSTDMLATTFGWDGNSAVSVQFRTPATATQEASVATTVNIPARPPEPPASDFTITQPASGGSDGRLNGITSAMEYKTDPAAAYTDGQGIELANIADNTTYTIRTKATASAFASKTASVTVASKATAQITFVDAIVPYNGVAQEYTNATTDASGGIMTYTYVADQNSTLTSGKPQNVGTYQVTASYVSSTHIGSKTVTLTINTANVTITADDKTIVVGDALPDYTATTTGLMNGETISGISFTSSSTDSSTKGTYTITPTNGTITGGGNGNYSIIYVTGTLTIALETGVIDTAIASANTAKSGITTNENAPTSVASGTKFVTAAEMQALIDAIATAKAAKATVDTATEAQEAAAALDAATAIFKSVIKTGSAGSGGGGGGGGTPIVTPPPTTPTNPEQVEVKVENKVDKDGNLTVTVKNEDVTDAISNAKTTENGITIVINVKGSKTARSVNFNLPKTVQETIINNKIVNTIFVVDNPNIKISMNLLAIMEINAQAKADVNLTATLMDSDKLTGNAKTIIGTRPAFDLRVSYGNGKQIQTFGEGRVSVTIPYTLGANEKAGNVYAVYVDANGNVQWLTDFVYDSTAKALRFSTNHFSIYGVGYKTTNVAFTDIANHWAKNDIDFVVNRGLFAGTSTTTFNPDTAMTRGMFVTALGRLSGIDANSYKTSKFSDVSATAYYAPYVNWAVEKNITTGTTATTFAPDQIITRQEMAVFMENYAKAMQYNVAKTHEAITFADHATIPGWASEAVKSMQMAGVIMGKNNNRFDPAGVATRAEASAILCRYTQLIIDTQTGQGRETN